MKKLIATKGLPACGKTTWANEEKARLEAQGLKVHISTKDDIRSALAATGWTWSREAEKMLSSSRTMILRVHLHKVTTLSLLRIPTLERTLHDYRAWLCTARQTLS